MLLNHPLPYFHTVIDVSELNQSTIQKDILYKCGDYVLILNEQTLSVGLDASYLRGVEVNFGQAAKAVREILYHHFPDLLEELYWTPMYLEPTSAITWGSMECVGGYPIRFVPLDRISNDHWDEIIAWFNQKPPLTEILELITRENWETICKMLEEISIYQHLIFKLNTSPDENALEVILDNITHYPELSRLVTDVNFAITHDEMIKIIHQDIQNWGQFIAKTIGTDNWYKVKRLIVKIQNEQRQICGL